jgi:hypothetical protein
MESNECVKELESERYVRANDEWYSASFEELYIDMCEYCSQLID